MLNQLSVANFGNNRPTYRWANMDRDSVINATAYIVAKLQTQGIDPEVIKIVKAANSEVIKQIVQAKTNLDNAQDVEMITVPKQSVEVKQENFDKQKRTLRGWEAFSLRLAKHLKCENTQNSILAKLGVETKEWRVVLNGALQPEVYTTLEEAQRMAIHKSDWNIEAKVYRDFANERLVYEAEGKTRSETDMKLKFLYPPYKDRRAGTPIQTIE